VDGVVHLGHHPAGRAHLDHPRVAAQLLAYHLGALRLAVGHPQLVAQPAVVVHPGERIAVQIGVSAGGGEDGAGGVDRRARNRTFGDRGRHVDAESGQFPDARDARVQRRAQSGDAAGGTQGDR
jgi:hypothetical protein